MDPVGSPSRGSDTRALMLYEANKKSAVVAPLLWFFLGSPGGHRFYTQRTGSAVAMSAVAILLLTIFGAALSVIGVGFLLLAIMGIWVLVDAFLIPGWISACNNLLVHQLAG